MVALRAALRTAKLLQKHASQGRDDAVPQTKRIARYVLKFGNS